MREDVGERPIGLILSCVALLLLVSCGCSRRAPQSLAKSSLHIPTVKRVASADRSLRSGCPQ